MQAKNVNVDGGNYVADERSVKIETVWIKEERFQEAKGLSLRRSVGGGDMVVSNPSQAGAAKLRSVLPLRCLLTFT